MAAALAAIILFAGCCTARRATQWEYKVAEPQTNPNNTRQALEPFLNDMAKDGWIFIERDNTGWCYFKRPKQ
jgi:ABC-type phosphate/phosphonate transport system substrate-binding protein